MTPWTMYLIAYSLSIIGLTVSMNRYQDIKRSDIAYFACLSLFPVVGISFAIGVFCREIIKDKVIFKKTGV